MADRLGTTLEDRGHAVTIRDIDRDGEVAERPAGFYQISLSSATEEGPEQAATYVDTLLEETGWGPDRIGLFGGRSGTPNTVS